MKHVLTLLSLSLSFNLFAQNRDLTLLELINYPKKEIISLQITDTKPQLHENYNFGKVIKGSLSLVEYQIQNHSNTPLDFVSGKRTTMKHLKGGHNCNKNIAPGSFCSLYFYYNPEHWGKHSGAAIIEFAQGRLVKVNGYGRARYN